MTGFRVAIAKGTIHNTKDTTRKAIQLSGEFQRAVAGARWVLVKPNVTVAGPTGSAICTDLGVVEAVIDTLRQCGCNDIVVADGPGADLNRSAFIVTGYDRAMARLGVRLVDLTDEPTRSVTVPDGMAYQELEIPEIVLKADAIIDIANLKTHTSTLATLGAKNLFGVPPVRRYGLGGHPRREFHQKGVDKVIHDICRVVPIAFTIIDGTLSMEGNGPIKGTPVPAGLVIAGRNLVATDVVGCHLMKIDPREVAHLVYLSQAGLGPIDLADIEVVGEAISSVAQAFRQPDRRD